MENEKKDVNVTETDVSDTNELDTAATEDTVVDEIENDLENGEPKKEAVKKRKLNKKAVTGIIALILVAVIGVAAVLISNANTPKDEEFTVTQIKEEIDYTEDGEPVDPMDLVVVKRADEESEKNLTKASVSDGLTVTAYPEIIDTSVVGDTEVTYTIVDTKNNDYTKKEKISFTVVNAEAPKFSVTASSMKITVGKDFDPKSLVKDAGDLKLVEEEPAAKEDGTYDYGWYTITSNVKTDKAGSYTVKFHAVGTNGVATDKTVNITVEEKESSTTKDEKTSSKDSSSTSSKTSEKKDSSSSSKKSTSSTNKSSSKSNTSSSNNSNSGNTNSNANTNTNSNTSSQTTDNSSSQQQQQTCTDVYHDAEGHWETVVTGQKWIEDSPAQSYQDGYTCNGCGKFMATSEEAEQHATDEMLDNNDYTHTWSSHYAFKEATGHYEDVTTDKYVIDKAAYWETVCQ